MLSPTQRAMVAALRSGYTVPTERLVAVIYGDRRDGGPDDPHHAIRSQMHKMREKLLRFGIEIETVGGHGRGAIGYRLRPEHRPALNELFSHFGDVTGT